MAKTSRKKKEFVEGIYNYCDRWCERCESTADCFLFNEEQKTLRRHKRRGEDPHDEKVWVKDIERSFKRTLRLIARDAKRFGIDMKQVEEEAAKEPPPDFSKIDKHPLSRDGMTFCRLTMKLIEALREELGSAADDINNRGQFMEVRGEAKLWEKMVDALEVLRWDSSLVAVKIKRVIDNIMDSVEEPEDKDFHLRDAGMTGAIVLRCLQRDKVALLAVYDWDKTYQDLALKLLAHCERIGQAIKALLPDVRRYLELVRVAGTNANCCC